MPGQSAEVLYAFLAGHEVGRNQLQLQRRRLEDLFEPRPQQFVVCGKTQSLGRVVADHLYSGPFEGQLTCKHLLDVF